MRENRSFWKAVHSLSHPLSVLAILLLLFNDHYLRWHYPSWLTGKLGDFSWLVFAPFVAAMLFSWLAPQKPRLIGLLSIAFIGLWFASFKTIPLVMDLTKNVLEALVGWRGTLGMDASDLLTLPALGISWLIWKNAREDRQYLRPVIYVAFGLGIMGTLASDSSVDVFEAVNMICESEDGSLFTSTARTSYYENDIRTDFYWESNDGGLNWRSVGALDSNPMQNARCSDGSSSLVINAQNGTMYRWERGERIEYSIDNGQGWLLLRDLYELRQESRVYANHNGGISYYILNDYKPSPVSGLIHSETGNLVLAMSRDGVLTITPTGETYWAAVGEYQLADMYEWKLIQEILFLYQFLLPTLLFLILVSTIVIIHSERAFTRYWLYAGWVSWIVLFTTFHFANLDWLGVGEVALTWGIVALASLVFIGIPMSLWALYHLFWHYRNAILPILVSGIVTCLANFFPMFLWSQGTIPRYDVAVLFSLGLTAAVLATCYAYFRPKLPNRFVPEKEKRKNDEA